MLSRRVVGRGDEAPEGSVVRSRYQVHVVGYSLSLEPDHLAAARRSRPRKNPLLSLHHKRRPATDHPTVTEFNRPRDIACAWDGGYLPKRPSGTSQPPAVTSSVHTPGPIRRPRWPSTTHGRPMSLPPARCSRSAPSPPVMRAGGIQIWPATYQSGYSTHSETTRYPASTVSTSMAPAAERSWVAVSPTAPPRFAPRASRETRRPTGSSTWVFVAHGRNDGSGSHIVGCTLGWCGSVPVRVMPRS
jgi:hypothetical protein